MPVYREKYLYKSGEILIKLIKYSFVGLISLFIFFIVLYFLFYFCNLSYFISSAISTALSTLGHFFINLYFTFDKRNFKLKYMIKYSLVASFNAALQLTISNYFFYFFRFDPYLSAIIGIGISTIIGFTFMRLWVFNE